MTRPDALASELAQACKLAARFLADGVNRGQPGARAIAEDLAELNVAIDHLASLSSERDGVSTADSMRAVAPPGGDLLTLRGKAPEPVCWAIFDSQGFYETREFESEARDFCERYNKRVVDSLKPYTYTALYEATAATPMSECCARDRDPQGGDPQGLRPEGLEPGRDSDAPKPSQASPKEPT